MFSKVISFSNRGLHVKRHTYKLKIQVSSVCTVEDVSVIRLKSVRIAIDLWIKLIRLR